MTTSQSICQESEINSKKGHVGQKWSDSFQSHDLKGVLVKHMYTVVYDISIFPTFNVEIRPGLNLVAGAGVLAHVLGHRLGHGELVDRR